MTMCVSYVYKRRKLRNSVALLPEKVTKNSYEVCSSYISSVDSHCCSTVAANDEVCKLEINSFDPTDEASSTDSPLINGKSPIFMLPSSQIPADCSGKQPTDSSNMDGITKSEETPIREVGSAQKASNDMDLNLITEHGSSSSDDCSSPDAHMGRSAMSTGSEAENVAECSYIDASCMVEMEPPYDSSENSCMEESGMSTRGEAENVAESSFDVSVKVIVKPPYDPSATSQPSSNNNQLVGDAYPISIDLATKGLDGDITRYFLACQICNLMGNSSDMLICDLCEKACHLHCCSERTPLREDWYCQTCCGNRQKSLPDAGCGSLFSINGQCRRRMLRLELGPILFMLSDTEPYTSKVRIGQSFQAEVPEWPVTPSQSEDPFGELTDLDMGHPPILRVGNINSHALDSIGNWVQCRDKHGCGAICGKWRRAPIFIPQTDDWDCSCAVLWDPYHADCFVPQELETEDILKQLKYIELLRSRFPKQVSRQTRS